MGQLTLSRFRGDTTFGLVARIVSTFTGCLIGVVMWWVGNFERCFPGVSHYRTGIFPRVMVEAIPMDWQPSVRSAFRYSSLRDCIGLSRP